MPDVAGGTLRGQESSHVAPSLSNLVIFHAGRSAHPLVTRISGVTGMPLLLAAAQPISSLLAHETDE